MKVMAKQVVWIAHGDVADIDTDDSTYLIDERIVGRTSFATA